MNLTALLPEGDNASRETNPVLPQEDLALKFFECIPTRCKFLHDGSIKQRKQLCIFGQAVIYWAAWTR